MAQILTSSTPQSCFLVIPETGRLFLVTGYITKGHSPYYSKPDTPEDIFVNMYHVILQAPEGMG